MTIINGAEADSVLDITGKSWDSMDEAQRETMRQKANRIALTCPDCKRQVGKRMRVDDAKVFTRTCANCNQKFRFEIFTGGDEGFQKGFRIIEQHATFLDSDGSH